MFGNRRFARYPVSLRLRLLLEGGELETITEDVSLAGFSALAPNLPEDGSSFGFMVHLPDGKLVSGMASAMRVSPDGLAGFSCEFNATHRPTWEAFITQEKSAGGVWRMLARYASSGGGEQDSPRSIIERGRFSGLAPTRAEGQGEGEAPPTAVRLHMVGENGEAYRVAFEKHESQPPEQSAFAAASPRVLELARLTVARILSQDVFLRRSPQAPIEAVRLVELKRGGYAYVVQHAGKPGLLGLHGSELIVVQVDGKPCFPFFDAQDLERIACDTFRRESDGTVSTPTPPPAAGVKEERFSEAYRHKVVDNLPVGVNFTQLRAAIAGSERVQTRTYGERTLRLFPDIWVQVERPAKWPAPLRGFAMEDGDALCVFVLAGPDAPRVVKLEESDYLSLIRDA